MHLRLPKCSGSFGRALQRWTFAAAAFVVWLAPAAALAAAGTIDTLIVHLRGDAATAGGGTLAAADRDALQGSLRTSFSLVGHTRDGSYILQLATPLQLDVARAAVNRARLLPQVVYMNVSDPAATAPGNAAAARAGALLNPSVIQMIVKYRDPALTSNAAHNVALPQASLNGLGTMAGQPIASQRPMSGGAYVVRLFQALPVDQAASLARYFETDPTIEYAVPDLLKQPLLVPNDPLYASQWHYMSPPAEMGGVNLPPAWDITRGSASIVVAVIDTGSLAAHPDLAGRYIGGYDFITNSAIANDGDGRDADPSDPGDWISVAENASGFFAGCGVFNSSFHGAHVAGTIGAATNNGTGVAGINWVSRILPVRVLGKCGGYTSDIADGIRWAAGLSVPGVPANANPARVLNLSLGGYACDSNGQNCGCDIASQSAINAAVAAGAVVVVAAGNSNRPAVESSPADCSGVITVGATGRLGERSSYSNYGSVLEISAPGGNNGASVWSTTDNGPTTPASGAYTYGTKQGTSMATPHVAGIASLMLSVNPALTPSQVMSKIQTSARIFPTATGADCTTAQCGAGIIDAAAAVIAAGSGTAATATTTTLTSSGNPANAGTTVTLTASVTGAAPSGNVTFTEGGAAIGCPAATLTVGNPSTATCSLSTLSVATHSIIATYSGDAANLGSVSSALAQGITATSGSSTNVALASAGGVASASSSYSAAYPPASLINNDRTGASWGNGGGWNDASGPPSWVQIVFNGTKTLDHVVVYTLQDNYNNPVEPSDTLTFSNYGVRDFTVQGWNGSAWVTLGTVTGNNLVKRTVTFTAYATDRIRINITGALASYARLTEVEAWTAGAVAPPTASTTTLTSSANPANAGTTVTLTASVTGAAPSGNVTFTEGGAAIGCPAATLTVGNPSTATCSLSTLSVATHSIIATYSGDAANLGSVSSALAQGITATSGSSTNVALASAGGVASASSSYSAAYPPASLINNDRTGASWGNGGGWNDASGPPSWVQIVFNGTKTLDHVVVYTLQDNYNNPVEPSDTLTFSNYGVRDFTVQGWNGSAWVTLGTVTGNNLVKRTVTFTAYATDRIRINITGALASYARLTEVEAWTAGAVAPPTASTTTLTSSANPANAGTTVTLTASVTGAAPSGNVTFTEGGAAIGCPAATLTVGNPSTATCSLSTLSVATHSIIATYSGDAANLGSVSSALAQGITATSGSSTNVALASAGGVASASSSYSAAYPPASLINNDRTGASWGNGGGWNDASGPPSWVQIVFNGTKTLDHVVVYTLQDNYNNPVEPSDTLTFSNYGVRDFTVQGWNGSAWVTLGTVTGNNLVKRTVTFTAYATDRIRINITGALASYARLTEVEAWTAP